MSYICITGHYRQNVMQYNLIDDEEPLPPTTRPLPTLIPTTPTHPDAGTFSNMGSGQGSGTGSGGRCRPKWTNWITVEPIVFLFYLTVNVAGPAHSALIYYKVSQPLSLLTSSVSG